MVLVTSVIIAFGLLLLAFGAFIRKDKKDAAHVILAVGAGVVVIGFVGVGGYFAPLSGVPLAIDTGGVGDVAPEGAVVKPYTKLAVLTQIWSSGNYVTAAGTFKVFEAGVDPSLANSNPKESITIASGVGNSTTGSLQSATDYVMVFDGSTTYYDQWYNGIAFPGTSQLPYVQTTESAISLATIDVRDIMTIATISDPLNEAAITGVINGQTNVSGLVGNSNELQVGADVSPANGDTIWYNKTNGDGSFYLDIIIGFDGADKAVKNPVLHFVNDRTTPFDGNEFSKVTLVRQSGTEYDSVKDITDSVNKNIPVTLGSFREGGDTGVYRVMFNGDESLMDAGADTMYVYVDDNGEYLGQDILSGTKATASSAITIGVRA